MKVIKTIPFPNHIDNTTQQHEQALSWVIKNERQTGATTNTSRR